MEFFREFVRLETVVRALVSARFGDVPRVESSFERMIDALFHAEMLSQGELQRLRRLQHYRNLVFHGHLTEVDMSIVEEAKVAAARLERYLEPGILPGSLD